MSISNSTEGDEMTELLYMKDIEGNYIKEFEAEVVKKGENYVVLDRSAFYPLGGGQPSDKGIIKWGGKVSKVSEVLKKDVIRHVIDGEIPEGRVVGTIDWDRRYAHMRMHTAQHIISDVVYDLFKARTVGNQIYAEKSRVDFCPISLTEEDLQSIQEECDKVISRHLQVKVSELERNELEAMVEKERYNLDLLPKAVRRLRVVEISNFDICPCAGTHVRDTGEIGKLKIIKKENKGKDTQRIIYILNNP